MKARKRRQEERHATMLRRGLPILGTVGRRLSCQMLRPAPEYTLPSVAACLARPTARAYSTTLPLLRSKSGIYPEPPSDDSLPRNCMIGIVASTKVYIREHPAFETLEHFPPSSSAPCGRAATSLERARLLADGQIDHSGRDTYQSGAEIQQACEVHA